MTAKEVAELTGLHAQTIYKLTQTDRIPYYTMFNSSQRKVGFSERAIRLWMGSDAFKLMTKRNPSDFRAKK